MTFVHSETCEAGKYTSTTLFECVSCPPGQYAPFAQVDECLTCGTGSSTGQPSGAETCTACNPGTFSLGEAVECSNCDAGSFSEGGQSSCTLCEKGKHSPLPGSGTCDDCPVKSSSYAGSPNCTLAAEDFYIDSKKIFAPCPSNAVCPGGLATPRPKGGYWVERRNLRFASDIVKCPRSTCLGAADRIDYTNNSFACWERGAYEGGPNATDCDADGLICLAGKGGPQYCDGGTIEQASLWSIKSQDTKNSFRYHSTVSCRQS